MYPAPTIKSFLGNLFNSKISSLVKTFALFSAPSVGRVLVTAPVLITILEPVIISSPLAVEILTSVFDTKLPFPLYISTFSLLSRILKFLVLNFLVN